MSNELYDTLHSGSISSTLTQQYMHDQYRFFWMIYFGQPPYRLKKLRSELAELRAETRKEFYLMQKAMHRVMASYQVKDFAQKIALLRSAVEIYPAVFNGFNAIGYAYLEQNEITEAIDAFKDAVHHHPKAKEGYFDLAHAYLKKGNTEFCLQYLRDAVQVDPSSKDDLPDNPLFREILNNPEYQRLF